MIIELDKDNFDNETNHGLKLVEFYTTWCSYCKNQRIELEDLKESGVWIGTVDAQENPKIAQKYEVKGYPTFILLKDGTKIAEFAGLHTKSQLLAKLMNYIG